MNWKGNSWSGCALSQQLPKGTEKRTENLIPDIPCRGSDLNPRPSDIEARVVSNCDCIVYVNCRLPFQNMSNMSNMSNITVPF
jgi:hypothetical protein